MIEYVILSRRDYTWMRGCARDSVSVGRGIICSVMSKHCLQSGTKFIHHREHV